MSDQKMDVFLLAMPQVGVERSDLVSNLAVAFKKDFQAIEKMLRRPRTLVKSDVEAQLAAKYKLVIEKAGGQCELVTQGQNQVRVAAAKPPSRSSLTKTASTLKTQVQPLSLTPVISTVVRETPNFESVASYCITCDTAIRLGQIRCAKCSVAEYAHEDSEKSINTVVSTAAFIVIAGLIIAIAFPAYNDYSARSKVKSSMPLVVSAHKAVASFIKKTRSYPNENMLVGLSDKINDPVIESIKLKDEASLEVTYRFPSMEGKNTILWTPVDTNNGVAWTCKGGSMHDRYRQKECWMGDESVINANDLTQGLFSNDKKLSIGMPSSWKAKELMPNAILGAANLNNQSYVAIMADPKTDFMEDTRLEDYVSVVQQQLAMKVTNGELVRGSRKITIKNLPAERFMYRGNVDGVKMAYVVTLFEDNDNFYRLFAWTPQSLIDKNKALLESVSRSVRFAR